MEARKVLDAVFKYLENNIAPGMSDLQEILFYAVREAMIDEYDTIMHSVTSNPFLRAVVAMDKDGDVEVEKLADRVRKAIERKGSITFDVPMYGKLKFVPDDIDNVLMLLKEDNTNESYQVTGRPY